MPKPTVSSAVKSWSGTAGVAKPAGEQKIFKSITSRLGAAWGMIRLKISSLFAPCVIRALTDTGKTRSRTDSLMAELNSQPAVEGLQMARFRSVSHFDSGFGSPYHLWQGPHA